jgi:hypothetical protein
VSELLFGAADPDAVDDKITMANAAFGERVGGRRYKMPLLPGESGPKSIKGANWVSGGIRSCTNLAGAASDTRALGDWERERTQIGLGLRVDLQERLALLVQRARVAGIDFSELGQDAEHKAVRAELKLIHAEAKAAAGGDIRTQMGTNRHDSWEERGKSGLLFGTSAVQREIEALEQLLADNHLVRVPGLSERVVRNVAFNAVGRFDDVLMDTRTGRLFMSDLKTKQKQFWSMLEVRIQLAVYASAEWLLRKPTEMHEGRLPGEKFYERGPLYHVDQKWGIVLHAPSNGAPPKLLRANLEIGRRDAERANAIIESRAQGKSVAAFDETVWTGEL